MTNAALTAVVSGTVAVITSVLTAAVTYLLTKRREQEADWRKLKLERYGEYVAALSGIIQGREISRASQARYADAVNGMSLMARPSVLAALHAYLHENSYGNTERTDAKHDELLNRLVRTIRQDVAPARHQSTAPIAIRFYSVPPPASEPF